MKRSVAALKHAYEDKIFPCLDAARTQLGVRMDDELVANKGRIMREIEERRREKRRPPPPPLPQVPAAAAQEHDAGAQKLAAASSSQQLRQVAAKAACSPPSSPPQAPSAPVALMDYNGPVLPQGCTPSARVEADLSEQEDKERSSLLSLAAKPAVAVMEAESAEFKSLERIRSQLFAVCSSQSLESVAARSLDTGEIDELGHNPRHSSREGPVVFGNHSFGQMPPAIHARACSEQIQLFQRGDLVWDHFGARIVPEAAAHVRRMLHIEQKEGKDKFDLQPRDPGTSGYRCHVEFGHNTFDLVSKLLSARLVTEGYLRVLTTDSEFFSLNRQIKQLSDQAPQLNLNIAFETVSVEPVVSFVKRFMAAAAADAREASSRGSQPFNLVCVSQVTFKSQQTLLRDVGRWGRDLQRVLPQSWLLVDACHAFCAIDTDLSNSPSSLFYVSTLMKHAASGANGAFMLVPQEQQALVRPLVTGWLADLSVLAPLSHGVSLSDAAPLGFEPGSALAGGTPAYIPALLVFNSTMRAWQENNLTVARLHAYTMALHARFWRRLSPEAVTALFPGILRDAISEAESHGRTSTCSTCSLTLALPTGTAELATHVVLALRKLGVVADSRGEFVRFGMGLCHSAEDVDQLVDALECVAASLPMPSVGS